MKTKDSKKTQKFKSRRIRNNLRNAVYNDVLNIHKKYFKKDAEIIFMRETYTNVIFFYLLKTKKLFKRNFMKHSIRDLLNI